MNYIYISQGANDFLCAEQLKKYLKSILPIWCPYDDMPYGADASEVIPRKIKEAGAMLLVLSDWALSSKQVSRELHLADKYGVPILPVAATDVELNEKFEYFLCDIKVKNINGFDYAPEVLDSLVADLKKYVDVLPSAAEESLPAPQPVTAEPTPEPEQPAPAQANAQPQAEENPAFTARLAGALPLLRTGEERKESDYGDIVATGDKISDYLTRCGTTNELSLVTEGSTFVRYMFACGEETTADAVKEAKALIAADPALARADVYLDEKNGSVVADVPVKERSEVLFSSFLSDENYREEKPLVPVGKDVNDNGVFADLAKNGKLLVTGGTAAERNNFLTAALLSLAVKYDPAECAVLLSDGDGSLSALGTLPSLSATLTGTEPAALVRAISPLDWLAGEAESRKQLFFLASDAGHTVADIDAYNACVGDEKLKRILVVISGTDGRDSALSAMTEEKLAALGEIAKYGLALVFSAGASDERQAQNFDAVLSFAEDCLTGDGDLCFKTSSYTVRAQAPALSEEEVQSVLAFLTSCEERQTDESISAAIRLASLRNFKEYQRRSAPVQLSLSDIPEPAETSDEAVTEETVEPITETSSEKVAEETEEPVAEAPSEEVTEETKEPVAEVPSEEVAEETEEPVAEESSEEPAEDEQAEQEEPLDPLFSVSLEEEEQTETAKAPQEETEQVTAVEPSSVGQSEEEIPATDEPAPVCEEADEPAEPEISGETEENEQQAEETEEVILSETDEKAAAFVEHYAAAPTDLEVDEENGEVYEPAREECASPVDESAEIADETAESAEEPTESEEPAEETTENEEGISEDPASEEESEAEELPAEAEEEPVATIEESAEPTAESEQETPAEPSAKPEEELDVPEEQSAQEPSVPAEEPASPSIEEEQAEQPEEIPVSSEEEQTEQPVSSEENEPEGAVEPTAEPEQKTPVETPAEPSVESDETQDEQEEQPTEEYPVSTEESVSPSIEEEQAEQSDDLPVSSEESVPEEDEPEEAEAAMPVWTYVPDEQRPPKIYLDALRLVIDRKRVGISILQQRPLMLNYSKARSIIEWMTQMGYVSKPDPLGNRTLLITMDDYRTMYS